MINFVTINKTAYDALKEKDINTIYFLKDRGIIVNNGTQFGQNFQKVDTLPVAPIEDVIYMLPNLEGYTLISGKLEKILTPATTISTQYTLSFNIISSLIEGPQAIPIIAPENGTIASIDIVSSVVGTTDAIIDIEKMNKDVVDTEGAEFVSIFTAGKEVIVPTGKLTNKTATAYELADNNINKGDILRLNVKNTGTTLSGISLQITIAIN